MVVVGLVHCTRPISGHIFRGCLAKFAAGGSVGPQLHSGKFLSNFTGTASLSRFSISLCAYNILDAGAAHPAHRARLLSPRAVLRHCGRPGNYSNVADSSPYSGERGNCKVSPGGVSACRAAYRAGNLLRPSASVLRSRLLVRNPVLRISPFET